MSHPQPKGVPITVAVCGNSPLLAAGLEVLLAPHLHRVCLVELDELGECDVLDVLLYDVLDVNTAFGCHQAGHLALWTWETDAEFVTAARVSGAAGALWKGLDIDVLVNALELIAAGTWTVAGRPFETNRYQTERADVHPPVSDREAEILARICRGEGNQQIADALFISINTVKSCIRSMYRKLDVTSRANAVRWGVRRGYAQVDRRPHVMIHESA